MANPPFTAASGLPAPQPIPLTPLFLWNFPGLLRIAVLSYFSTLLEDYSAPPSHLPLRLLVSWKDMSEDYTKVSLNFRSLLTLPTLLRGFRLSSLLLGYKEDV